MGLGYSLFGKPLLILAAVLAALSGLYLLPEHWPDHAAATEAIRHDDTATLARYLARGLPPEERAQWRSYFRRTMARTTSVGVGGTMPDVGPAKQSLLSYALSGCRARESARLLVAAGANVSGRDPGAWTLLGLAAGCEDAALVASMLARGADPNADEPDGGTVLWEPTNLGWRPRPFDAAIVSAMQARGAIRPARPPVRR
ncbi:MAG: hypothetical protein MUF79_13305 [Burkholderiales bacterium]|nr:hypothetical protein [Burkholderiales bacterium]